MGESTSARRSVMKSLVPLALITLVSVASAADWPQLQGDALRSGNAPEATLPENLGLVGTVPLTDAIQAAPVVAGGTVYAIDGSGVVHAIDAQSLKPRWTFQTRGGPGNV